MKPGRRLASDLVLERCSDPISTVLGWLSDLALAVSGTRHTVREGAT